MVKKVDCIKFWLNEKRKIEIKRNTFFFFLALGSSFCRYLEISYWGILKYLSKFRISKIGQYVLFVCLFVVVFFLKTFPGSFPENFRTMFPCVYVYRKM